MPLGERIRQARKERGLTQQQVADHFGIAAASVSNWETDTTQPEAERLPDLARLLGTSIDWLMGDGSGPPALFVHDEKIGNPPLSGAPTPGSDVSHAVPVELPSLASLPKDVPVFGITVGGRDGDFAMNGQVVDRLRRPPALFNVPDAFALFVVGDSMSPWKEDGDVVYIHPGRPVRPGDYVVIELKAERDGEPGRCLLKRLKQRNSARLILQQYTPADDNIIIQARTVRAIYKVLKPEELLAG